MKTCKWCGSEIGKAASCSRHPVAGFNQRWDPILFGEEDTYDTETKRCPGCNVSIKGRHHVYCPIEECPHCKGKMNQCGCFYVMKEK